MLAILAAVALAATAEHDTVLTVDGGRVVGTVVEESPQSVAIQLADGTFRRLPGGEVVRVDYADGSVSLMTAEPGGSPAAAGLSPPPYPPTYTPPATYTPAPPPEPQPEEEELPPPREAAAPSEASPATSQERGSGAQYWGAAGLGGSFFGGEVEPGLDVGRVFAPQVSLSFEGGRTLSPRLGLAVYFDLGFGAAGKDVRDYCAANAMSCSVETIRVGLLLRDSFNPSARTTAWVGVGTGFAYGQVAAAETATSEAQDVLQYSGWEMLRLRGGIDFRTKPMLGLYAGMSYVRYSHYEDAGGALALPTRSMHSVGEAGVRVTFWQ